MIIRSSANDEDDINQSKAGEYDSFLNINTKNINEIKESIDLVFDSYKKNKEDISNEEVIVQLMINDVSLSGVIFTHTLDTGAPYYVVNYDDISGLTNTVTSGDGEYSNKTLYIHRTAIKEIRSERFKSIISAVRELEIIIGIIFRY